MTTIWPDLLCTMWGRTAFVNEIAPSTLTFITAWSTSKLLATDDPIWARPALFTRKSIWGWWQNLINNGSWTEWGAIWPKILRVILKLDKCTVQVWFEIRSMILEQNCTTWSSVTTLLQPLWRRKIQSVPKIASVGYWWEGPWVLLPLPLNTSL